jgi:hypothetical protein
MSTSGAEIAPQLDNVIAACRRAVARGDADIAQRTAMAAASLLERRGPIGTAVALLDDAIGLVERPWCRTLVAASSTARVLGQLDRGLAFVERAEQLAVTGRDRAMVGRHRGILWCELGDHDRARAAYLDAREHARSARLGIV